MVQNPTRLNPSKILDPIITTLSSYYQVPECLPPLDPDPDSNGKPSDHLMVVMKPVSVMNNQPARTKKVINYRPYNSVREQQMQEWISKEGWSEVSHEISAHKKMYLLQEKLVSKYEEFFPEKERIITSDDQPFFSEKLGKMKRKKAREYGKNRKSSKWIKMNEEYETEIELAKKGYYTKKIKHLRKVDPKYWYRELKKLSSFDQFKAEEVIVEDIKDLDDKAQAELIADRFASVSQEYDKLKKEDIVVPDFSVDEIPRVSVDEVKEALAKMDANKSNVIDDVPAKILKKFANEILVPFTDVINSSITQGCWPDILKLEIVTPSAKSFSSKKY